ncbi:unnamed protein product [Amoebophrya sp. A120]|nr:unnamed protein product [Amoebophrya sp. A120]|eukprot:GSA120T00009229001.1
MPFESLRQMFVSHLLFIFLQISSSSSLLYAHCVYLSYENEIC